MGSDSPSSSVNTPDRVMMGSDNTKVGLLPRNTISDELFSQTHVGPVPSSSIVDSFSRASQSGPNTNTRHTDEISSNLYSSGSLFILPNIDIEKETVIERLEERWNLGYWWVYRIRCAVMCRRLTVGPAAPAVQTRIQESLKIQKNKSKTYDLKEYIYIYESRRGQKNTVLSRRLSVEVR